MNFYLTILLLLAVVVYLWFYLNRLLYVNFNPLNHYGAWITTSNPPTPETIAYVKETIFYTQIRVTIPKKYREYIKIIVKNGGGDTADPLHIKSFIGWKFSVI